MRSTTARPVGDAPQSGIFRANRFPNWVSPGLIVRTPQLRGKACQRYINLPCSAPLRQLKFPSLRKLSEGCRHVQFAVGHGGWEVPDEFNPDQQRSFCHGLLIIGLPLCECGKARHEASRCSRSAHFRRSTVWHTPLAGRNVSQLLCWNVGGAHPRQAGCSCIGGARLEAPCSCSPLSARLFDVFSIRWHSTC